MTENNSWDTPDSNWEPKEDKIKIEINGDQKVKESNFIARSWKGKELLWKVYWLYFVLLGHFVLRGIDGISILDKDYLTISYLGFVLVFYIWASTSVWKCAFNTKTKFWGYVARFIIVAGPISGVLYAINS